jgi:hypothetical protein
MKGKRNDDGTYLLENGTTVDEATYTSQLTSEDKGEAAPSPAPSVVDLKNLILEEENKRLKEALNTRIVNPTPQVDDPVPLGEGDVFNKPEVFLARIKQMIDSQVAPLRASQVLFDRQQQYAQLKMRLKQQQPGNAQALAFLEPLIDQFMEGREPTEANFSESLQRAIGAAALSNPSMFQRNAAPSSNQSTSQPANTQSTPVNQPANTSMLPPHLRPSPTSTSTSSDLTKIDMGQFDENQKRLMRENGQTPAQYLLMRDAPSSELTSKKFQDAYKKAGEAR